MTDGAGDRDRNPLRRDDGSAHYMLELLDTRPDLETRAVLQLTPEMAEEIGHHDAVFFVDADVSATRLRIEPVDAAPALSPFTHTSHPAEIVALARTLFGFSGAVFTCHIPVSDLSEGEGLSPRTKRSAERAAQWVRAMLPRSEQP